MDDGFNEHNWHACFTPKRPEDFDFEWRCPVCLQLWVWRRPPQPPPQWVRREAAADA